MSYCPADKGPGVLLRDYPAADLWCLLQCERAMKVRQRHNYTSTEYRANIETE
jgi:hypothetical protein